MLYMEGNGVPESAAQALQWFTKAAGAGDALGELQLANMHYHGVHQAINMEKAVLNFKSSAVHGSIVALYNLGLMYSVGDGVERNWPVTTLECGICTLECCMCPMECCMCSMECCICPLECCVCPLECCICLSECCIHRVGGCARLSNCQREDGYSTRGSSSSQDGILLGVCYADVCSTMTSSLPASALSTTLSE